MEGRTVRLFWLRAHVGTAGNESADQLAKIAASTTPANPDYDGVPMSYIKKTIREESVRKRQDRYEASSTGSVTRVFLPDVEKAYRTVRKIRPTPMQVQALTGHGGIGEYLHRFHLRDNPGCECDPEVSESVWYILTECPRFQADRLDLEHRIDKKIIKRNFAAIMGDLETATLFLGFAERAFRIATERNKTDRPDGSPPAGDYAAACTGL
ncbi:unnamed protein product [Arctia plantaginis]|uniref:RNase H type-1 domain-containing protein n=1 Tax=Arctia plantaginis TaxID=874455 RepID=A0A8S0YZH6_ARCPL|nr:unnamed protein product [Arctia plantaginis]